MKEEAAPAPPSGTAPANADAPAAVGHLNAAAPGQFAVPVLHEVLAALSHGEPKEHVLQLLTEKARLLTACESAAIALLEPDRASVTFVAASGAEATDLLGSRVRISDTVAGNTARTGEPFMAFRPTSGRDAGKDQVHHVESAAVVPIYDDSNVVGSFAALNKTANTPFDGGDFLYLSTLASAASVALTNDRLRVSEQRQSRELTVLYEAVQRVAGQLTAQEVLEAVVEQAAAHLENSGVAVFLTNDERTHLYIAADAGLSDDDRDVTLSTDAGVGALLFTAPRTLSLRFTDEEEVGGQLEARGPSTRFLSCDNLFPGQAARCGLAAPVRSGDVTHGVVLVVSGQPPGVFAEADANLLSILAAQAAVAIENAWLFEDATHRAEEATALYELSQAVNSTLRLPDILERVADSVLALLSVDKFALFLYDRRAEHLNLVVARGLPAGAAERLRPRIGEGIPGWVMEFETPTAVQDVAADHRNAGAPLHNEGVVSLTCMPLQVGAATIGVLAAMSSRRRLFTVAEMELLYTIANQAAIAIENARIYSDIRQRSSEMRKYFHRVARALGSSQAPEGVPELIASLTQEVMEADRCALYAVRQAVAGPLLETSASVGFRVEPSGLSSSGARETSPTGWVAIHARPLTVENLAEDARFVHDFERPARGAVSSYLGVPLRIGSDVVGVLEVYSRERRPWRGDEVRLLLTFASQAAIAFQNARLAQENEGSNRTSRLLERLLAMTTQSEPPLPEEVVAALALGLNAPVVTLYRREGVWTAGPASVPADTVPLAALVEAAGGSGDDVAGFRMMVAPNREAPRVAVAVLGAPDLNGSGPQHLLLETASRLLDPERSRGALPSR
jgi:GAF domain-containing protein